MKFIIKAMISDYGAQAWKEMNDKEQQDAVHSFLDSLRWATLFLNSKPQSK